MSTREALINAVKHAETTHISVCLDFPAQPAEPLILIIQDNGKAQQRIAPKAGHLGLHLMQESVDAIGATIAWRLLEEGGTAVIITAPLTSRSPIIWLNLPDLDWDAAAMAPGDLGKGVKGGRTDMQRGDMHVAAL